MVGFFRSICGLPFETLAGIETCFNIKSLRSICSSCFRKLVGADSHPSLEVAAWLEEKCKSTVRVVFEHWEFEYFP